MKKFMKAIAFATVMCMLLSTVAFAAEGALLDENVDKQLNITVEGAGNEQVALLVVAAGADRTTATPLYIDQKLATSGTPLAFTAKIADTNVTAVDVYAGYGTYATANNTAKPVATNVALTKPVTDVTLTKVAANFIQGESLKAEEQTGAGVWAEISVKAPAGAAATQMIWAIRYTDSEGEKVKYSDAINVTGYSIGNMLSGSIKLGLAFLNGSELNNIDPVTITAVDAIFLFEGQDDFEKEVFTNADDAANKKK